MLISVPRMLGEILTFIMFIPPAVELDGSIHVVV